jgi:hypothetical protein
MRGLKRILLAALGAIAVVGLIAGTASAATTSTQARGSLSLYMSGAFAIGSQQVTVPNRAVKVQGTVRPYVAGQWVKMRVYEGGRLLHTYGVRIRPSVGKAGTISYRVSLPRAGNVSVVVSHPATTELGAFSARHSVTVLNPSAGFGATGAFVRLIQQRLSALHFYIPQTGVYDQGTGLAVDAYHRLLRWGTYQTLDSRTVNALLNGIGTFPVRYPGNGKHAEGNLSLQLLALADGSHVVWILPISSGKPSTPTVLGNFHVYSRVPGYLPDGMYYSDFFYTGYAIHGYDPAPDYPASHGCMRLPIADAIPVYNWLAIGDAVDVYY